MNEDWYKLKNGYEYDISTFGRVRRSDNKRIIKHEMTKTGKPNVRLVDKYYERTMFCIEDLMIERFKRVIEDTVIVHLDGDLSNNRLENLIQVDLRDELPKEFLGEYEIWEDIPGMNGRYQVSNLGRVFSKSMEVLNKDGSLNRRKASSLILPTETVDGYLKIKLYRDGKGKSYKVHRLVLSTFYPNENSESLHVNHIDGNKTNNRLSNLEWTTPTENRRYNDILNIDYGKKTHIEVDMIDPDNDQCIKSFYSAHEAGSYLYELLSKEDRPKIKTIRNGIADATKSNKTYKGYLWKKKNK